MNWTDLAQDKDRCKAQVNTVMVFGFYEIREIS
jgi:hypothetical protein